MSSLATSAFYGASVADVSATGGGAALPMRDGTMIGTGDFISNLSAAKARGSRLILKFTGSPNNILGVNSEFSLAKWQAKMAEAAAKTNAQQMGNFVQDGTLLAHWMIDDLKNGSVIFPGGAPTYAEIESMASTSKSHWSQVPTTVRVENQYLKQIANAAGASRYTYLDFGWQAWHKKHGPALAFWSNHINDGRTIGLGAAGGFNLLNGGSGITPPWNTHPESPAGFGMSPQEIDACGAATSALTYLIGSNAWAQNPQFDDANYWNMPSIQTALQAFANVHIGRLQGPINWRDVSGGTSGSTQTVAGKWGLVDGSHYRTGDASSIPVPVPANLAVGNLYCIQTYSRDTARTAVAPSDMSEAARVSGSSGRGGEIALFYKIADAGDVGQASKTVSFSGAGGTGSQVMGRSYAFSGNTQVQAQLVNAVGSDSSWPGGNSNMGPVKPITSIRSDSLILICAGRPRRFGVHPTPQDLMSATTSGGESWNRLFILESSAGDDGAMFADYAITSGLVSITTKSWSQLTLASSSNSGPGVGFMVAFTPNSVISGQPPVIGNFDEEAGVTMSVASTLSFTFSSTGSTPITWSKESGPSNITLGASTGAFQWSPTTTGNYVISVAATNSFGSDIVTFTAAIVSSGSTVGGGSGNPNLAPTITHPGNKTVAAHDLLSFIVASNDAQGDRVALSLENPPTGAFIDRDTGQFIWIPSGEQGPGAYPVVVVSSDGQAESRSTFTVTVTDTPWTRDGGPSTQLGRINPAGNQFRRI